MVHWDDAPTEAAGKTGSRNDCSESGGNYKNAISGRCLDQFDKILKWTASQGLWALITVRASLAAGESREGLKSKNTGTVFTNDALRERFLRMWKQIAQRFKSHDMVAGYEILSEPRVEESQVSSERVREFYSTACDVVQSEDPQTPCVIGPAPFYHHEHLEHVRLQGRWRQT